MVGTLIVGAAAGVGAAGVAASFALTAAAFAVNFAVSLIVSRVFGQSGQGPQDSGTREQVPPSSVNAIPIVYGDAYLGGTFVDAVLSTDQKTMYYVVAVSCISPNGQFSFDTTKIYYGDRLVTFDSTDQTKVVSLTDEAGNVDTKISGNLYINLYKSNAAGLIISQNSAPAPNVVMGGSDIDVALRWPSSGRQMNALAFAIIKLNYNQDAGTTNLSPITFYAQHYLYSTGVAKPGDVWYDYITNTAYGGAVDPNFADYASAVALNVYSDQLITYTPSGGGSATQSRYRMNGVLDAGQTVLSNLDKIMSCADSWMAYNAAMGKWSIVINKAESTAYAFDDDNIIGEVRVSATDITQSINQVEAKFPDKGARDQPNFVNIATPALLLYPNEPTNKYSVTYDLCNDSVQAQYLANRILEQAREDLIVSFSTTYYGIQVDAGDVVSVTNADYGWNSKLFRVVKVNEASLPDGSLGAKLEMSEYSAAVYDDFNITQYTPVPNSDLPSVSYFSPLSAPTVSASNPSSAIPNFNISITIPAVGRVLFSELYYTTSPIPASSDWKLLAIASSIDGQPVTPSSTYVFANQVLPTGASPTATYYFAYIVGNDLAKSNRSPSSAAFTWSPVANAGPTGPTGGTGPTGSVGPTGSLGPTGTNGNSSRICYSKTTLSSLSPTPTTITTSGPSSFPPNNSWGTGTVWGATSPAIVAGESVYQSDGVYSPTTNETVWNVPYLSTLKVGQLSAISANLGTITTGQITNTSYNTTMQLGSVAGGSSAGATMYFERTGAASSALGPIIYGNDASTSKVSYSYAFLSNTGDTFIVFSSGAGGSYNGTFQLPSISSTFINLAVLGGTTGPSLSVAQQQYNGTAGNPVNPAGSFVALNSGLGVASHIKLASGTGFAYYIVAGVGGPFTGAHDGLIAKAETVVQGDILVDSVLVRKATINDTLYVVSKSTTPNQCALGVFNTSGPMTAASPPAALIDGYTEVPNELGDIDYVPIPAPEFYVYEPTHLVSIVNSIGEGQINVCGENGDIAVGDLIVTSSTAGKGMKQNDDCIRSYTVAKAREAATFSSPTEIKMIACIYVSG
jgi:hypothetical protein